MMPSYGDGAFWGFVTMIGACLLGPYVFCLGLSLGTDVIGLRELASLFASVFLMEVVLCGGLAILIWRRIRKRPR